MADAKKSDGDRILDCLKNISVKTHDPHNEGQKLGPDFRTDWDAKVKVVKESFHPEQINLINTPRVQDATELLDDEQDIDGQTTQPSPQMNGQELHQDLAEKNQERLKRRCSRRIVGNAGD